MCIRDRSKGRSSFLIDMKSPILSPRSVAMLRITLSLISAIANILRTCSILSGKLLDVFTVFVTLLPALMCTGICKI